MAEIAKDENEKEQKSPAKMPNPIIESISPQSLASKESPQATESPGDQLVPFVDNQTVVRKLLPDSDIQDVFLMATLSRHIVIAQCMYFLSLYETCFKIAPSASFSTNPKDKEESKSEILLIENNESKEQEIKVGIIGCGRVGRTLLTSIIRSNWVKTENILVSTRQPGLLKFMSSKYNVKVIFDNEQVISTCDIIFLCILPLQIDSIAAEVKKCLKVRLANNNRSPLIVSVLAGVNEKKIVSTLGIMGKETWNAAVTTKVNAKRVKALLAKESGENMGRQKVSDSLVKMYRKLSSSQNPVKPQEASSASPKPKAAEPLQKQIPKDSNRPLDTPLNPEDEENKVIKDFVMQEAASGLTYKREDEIIMWVTAYSSVFPEIRKSKIIESILGTEFEGTTSMAQLNDKKELISKNAEAQIMNLFEVNYQSLNT